ncbi:MAG: hypothetical protein R2778_14970 [Saprospiraceae bacterium]
MQKKVEYVASIKTLNPLEPAKCEIRMMMVWDKDWEKPRLVNNLIRMSKGEMVGVRYNLGKDWVGSSVGFFEPMGGDCRMQISNCRRVEYSFAALVCFLTKRTFRE